MMAGQQEKFTMFEVTIKCATIAELSALVAKLNGGVSANAIAAHTQTDDDDTTGDTPAAAGTVDKNGLPWDDRIHSTPATITTKGVWRAKRGVTPALVAQVEAELRARGGAPAPQQQQPAPMQQPVYPAQQPQMQVPAPQMQPPAFQPPAQMQPPAFQAPAPQFQQPAPVQQMQPAPMQQPAPQYPPEPQQYDFNSFMQRLQMLLQEKDAAGNALVDANYLNQVAVYIGQQFGAAVNAITDIAGNQQMIDFAIQTMRSQGRWH
jgi:hypothetical protein